MWLTHLNKITWFIGFSVSLAKLKSARILWERINKYNRGIGLPWTQTSPVIENAHIGLCPLWDKVKHIDRYLHYYTTVVKRDFS